MRRRSRALLATVAVLAALPGSASAAADEAVPVPMGVTATLDSCSGHDTCRIRVDFGAVQDAASYEAVIRGPDGTELVSAPAQAGTNSYAVPFRGNGTYSVQITAFGG